MKRFISLLLSVTMVFSFVGVNSYAAIALIDSEETNTEELSKIVLIVKSKVTIPENLTEFNYSFSGETSYSPAGWSFGWAEKNDNEDSIYMNSYSNERISVNCDTAGNITYYSHYNVNSSNVSAPKYLKEELKPMADDFLKRIASEVFEKLEFKSAENSGENYVYTYERIENGILMPENNVSVAVNYITSDINYASISWLYDIDIPSAETKITADEAKTKLGEKVTMKLQYRNRTEKENPNDENSKTKIIACLVYSPEKGYISIDAKTGEIYTTRNEWVEKNEYKSMNAMSGSAAESVADEVSMRLTDEEIIEIDKLKDLISKDEAIKILTSYDNLLIRDNLKAVSANLRKSYNKEDIFYWDINLSASGENKYSDYARATIDAKTGKLLSFYATTPSYYDEDSEEWKNINVKYTSEKCKATLESFIKGVVPEYFKDTKLSKEDKGYVLKYINKEYTYGGYSYRYNRINEDIEYSYNGIYGDVDGVTGKIYRFSYDWDDNVEFESPKEAISERDAYKEYVSKEGFNLVYEVNNINIYDKEYEDSDEYYEYSKAYDSSKEIRLVYRPDIEPSSISPFTGKQLNYDGKEYIKKEDFEYNDIAGNWAEKEINLLADIGIGLEDIEFSPDKSLTKTDIKKIYETIYKNIETKNEDITRLDLIKGLIKNLGIDEVAKIDGIYKVDYKDSSSIGKNDLGYVALSKGFNLIKDENGSIRANDKATRADLMYSIINLMEARAKLGKSNNYYYY